MYIYIYIYTNTNIYIYIYIYIYICVYICIYVYTWGSGTNTFFHCFSGKNHPKCVLSPPPKKSAVSEVGISSKSINLCLASPKRLAIKQILKICAIRRFETGTGSATIELPRNNSCFIWKSYSVINNKDFTEKSKV